MMQRKNNKRSKPYKHLTAVQKQSICKRKKDNPDDGISIAIRVDDLSVISRLINQVAWHRMSRCKQTPIEKYVDLH